MCDDEDRAPGRQTGQRRLNAVLRGGVDGGDGLVEDQDRGVLQQRPGDREALALSAGQVRSAVGEQRVEAVGESGDHVVALRGVQRLPDLVVGCRGAAEGEVEAHGVVEEVDVLEHRCHGAQHSSTADVADIRSADAHAAGVSIPQARDEIGDCRLSGAGGADERCDASRIRAH